jgi:hypothetical protein
MKRITIVFSLLFMLMLSCTVAFAGAQDFTLVNHSGFQITNVYVAPSQSDDWGDDVLGNQVLNDNYQVNIHFHHGERATHWDLQVTDSDGNNHTYNHFNLKEISKIILKHNGDATYE